MQSETRLTGLHWRLNPPYDHSFVESFLRAVNSGKARRLRANRVREVSSLTVRGVNLIIKRYFIRNRKSALKYLLVGSKGGAGWRATRAVLDRGVPTARPVALGTKRRGGFVCDQVLVLEEIPDIERLDTCLRESQRKERIALLRKLGRFVGEVCSKGVYHRDAHVGNILVRGGSGMEREFFLIDLDSVRCSRCLTPCKVRRTMAKLFFSLNELTAPDERQIVLDAARARLQNDCPSLETIESGSRRLARRQLSSRTRRCVKESSEFTINKAPGVKVFRRRDMSIDDMLQLILSHKDARRARDHRLLKESRRAYVTRVALRSSRYAKTYIVKEERYGPPLRFVLKLFRRSRSMQAWLSGHGFIVRGIPTARPIALVQERLWFVPYRSYLITEYLPDTTNVEEQPAGHGEQLPGLLPALAEAVAGLFNRKVYHSDLSVKNVLAQRGEGGEWSFYFIDLDAVSFAKRLTVRRRAKNLAQLDDSLRGVFDGAEVVEFLDRVVELTGGEPVEGFLQLVREMSTKRRMLREKRLRKQG